MRLLVLVPFAPRLDAWDGGGRVTAQLVLALARRHEVALLCVRSREDRETDPAIAAELALLHEAVRPPVADGPRARWSTRARNGLGMVRGRPRRATAARLPELERVLARTVAEWRPDVVQVEFEEMAPYVFGLPHPPPRVLTVHDPGVAAARERARAARGTRRLLRTGDLLAWRRLTRRAFASVDAAVVFTDRDRRRADEDADGVRLETIPLGVELPEAPLDPTGRGEEILFVGSYFHEPNLDAARRLVRTIFPQVRERRPAARLTLVGPRPPPELRALDGDGIEVTGAVPDVTPFLDRAAVVALPLRLGGGMRVKVLEALAAGKAVVCTPLAAEGLALTDGVHVLLAGDDEELAATVVRVLEDGELRRRLGGNARRWAAENLSEEARVEAYERLYDALAPVSPTSSATPPRRP